MPSRSRTSSRRGLGRCMLCWGVAILGTLLLADTIAAATADEESLTTATSLGLPSRSTTIALTYDNRRLVVVNRETHSVSVIRVRDWAGRDTAVKLAEIAVGQEPRCVAISPDNREAYVTNGLSGTVSVIALAGVRRYSVVDEFPVGPEPRGCALTPSGSYLFVANHTSGDLSLFSTADRAFLGSLPLGGNPTAIAITNDGDDDDTDETVFVTQFFAELVPNGPGEGFDTGRQGIVHAIALSNIDITRIPLSPLSNAGFTADRTAFCPQTNANLQRPDLAIFCPDVTAPAGSDVLTKDPQGCFPNQLFSAVIRGNRLWVPNICAGPEPPVQFRVNVQGAVHVLDTDALAEVAAEHVNLNAQIAIEVQPADPRASLGRIFANDLVAIDATQDGQVFLLVSRGGNYVMRATLDGTGKLNLGAPSVIRWQTGNIPNGVVISYDSQRAYVNNEVNVSVTSIDLVTNTVQQLDIPSGEPPPPGSFDHAVLVGKLSFFTALGIPDNRILEFPIRDFFPVNQRGKASDNGWSSCASCHPDGLADNVTWIFPAGPRQTLPLDGFFAKDNSLDQKLVLWSALRGSNTDFNNNSRGVQGGCGFASDGFATSPDDCLTLGATTPANPNIYDHGIVQGASDALDTQSLWVQTVRALHQPQLDASALEPGRAVFQANCASCHGGPKWTKSQIFHRDNPALDRAGAGAQALDPGVTLIGPQFAAFTAVDDPTQVPPTTTTITYLDQVGTFAADDPLETRGQGAASGQIALGAAGFVPPSLLGTRYHAPYLHHGRAQTLADVFPLHALGAGTIASTLTAQQQQDLLQFLSTIDGTTPTFRSEGDDFRDRVGIP